MVAALRKLDPARTVHVFSENWRAVAALFLLVIFMALIARTYIGDSTSPYGMCYTHSGRSIPCDAIAK